MRFLKTVAAVAAFAGFAAQAQAQTVLLHGEAGPNRGARAAALQWYADQVAERSAGDLTIDIQWGGALFKANAALSGIKDGVADMGSMIAVYFPQEMAAYGVADLPLSNPDAWVAMRATDDFMRNNAAVTADLATKNLVYIGTWTTSQVGIGCKGAAVRTVEDVKGLKVRGVGAYGKVFGEMGANMVRMSIYDAYQGLDTGLLDCSQGYSYVSAALKHYEVMDSYTILNWGQIGGLGIFMNKDSYDALSPAQQEVLMQTGSDMADDFGQKITAANAKAFDLMKENNVEIIELSEADRAQLVTEGKAFVKQWSENASKAGLPGEEMLAEYQALLAKWTEVRDTQGYPWAQN